MNLNVTKTKVTKRVGHDSISLAVIFPTKHRIVVSFSHYGVTRFSQGFLPESEYLVIPKGAVKRFVDFYSDYENLLKGTTLGEVVDRMALVAERSVSASDFYMNLVQEFPAYKGE